MEKEREGEGFAGIQEPFCSHQPGQALAAGLAGGMRLQASRFRTKTRQVLAQASLVQKVVMPTDSRASIFFTLGLPQISVFHKIPLIFPPSPNRLHVTLPARSANSASHPAHS